MTSLSIRFYCFAQLAASDDSHQHHEMDHQQTIGHGAADKDSEPTSQAPSTFKDKFKGFVSSVKEGASDVIEKLDEKRKEAVAGTKKLVDKIKNKYDEYKNGDSSEENVPRVPELIDEHAKHAADKVKNGADAAKDAVVDKTQNFMNNEKLN